MANEWPDIVFPATLKDSNEGNHDIEVEWALQRKGDDNQTKAKTEDNIQVSNWFIMGKGRDVWLDFLLRGTNDP